MERVKLSPAKLKTLYPKGGVHEACVDSLTPFGAFVVLKDGTPGIIRNRELCWENEPGHPCEVLTKGQTLRVLVLGIDRSRPRLELSLRQADRDPWKDIHHRYRVGQVCRGKVVALWRTGFFVELEPSINGFVPLRETAVVPPERVEALLWVGDTVEATIMRLDDGARQIELSIRQHLLELEKKKEAALRQSYLNSKDEGVSSLGDLLKEKDRKALLSFIKEHRKGTQVEAETATGRSLPSKMLPRILIADDDSSFRISLQRLLTRLGHSVEAVSQPEKAIELCAEKEFDVLLLDLNFSAGNMDGLEATRQILAIRPTLPIVISSGPTQLESHTGLVDKAKAAGARSLLLKPIELSSLNKTLASIVEGEDTWELGRVPDLSATEIASITPPFGSKLAGKDVLKSVRQQMIDIQQKTSASACVLFHMLPLSREVRVVTNTGATLKDYDESKYNLQATPVVDVIKFGKPILESDTSRNPNRFQHLHLLNFSSCIGVPIKSLDRVEYSLFLFSPQKNHFTDDHLKETLVAAGFIGVLIAKNHAEEIIHKVQPFVFAGQIGSMLIHELNNRLATILNDTNTLAVDNQMVSNDGPGEKSAYLRKEMDDCIQNLKHNSKAMGKITRLYLGLIGVEKSELVSVNEIIHRATDVMTPIADSYHVKILTDLEDDIPSTLSAGVRLEQIFVNLILNAIQQTNLAKGGGELVISSRFAQSSSELPIQIRFTDTGPGIHGKYQDQVFELGFSTRSDGTGLGLFITRWLARRLGGRISIEESIMMMGTRFLVELPLVLPSVEAAEV